VQPTSRMSSRLINHRILPGLVCPECGGPVDDLATCWACEVRICDCCNQATWSLFRGRCWVCDVVAERATYPAEPGEDAP